MSGLFDDIFHVRGDDDDIQEDEIVDFDDIIINMDKQSEIQVVHVIDKNEDNSAAEEREQGNEEMVIISTKNRMQDSLPFYLSAKNKLFDQTIGPILNQTAGSINMDDLRQIAYLVHNLALNKLFQLQWKTYLLSGTGHLKIQQPHVKMEKLLIWPMEIKPKIVQKKFQKIQHESQITHIVCLEFVHDQLHQLGKEMEQLQLKLNDRKHRLNVYTDELDKAIEQFVHVHYVNQFELIIQNKIVGVEYDYLDRIIELEYLRLKPNTYQLRVFQNLTEDTREHEQAKYEVDLLKQRIFYKQLPDDIHSFQLPIKLNINTIRNDHIRSGLYNHYERLIQQTKSNLIAIHVTVAEATMRQWQNELNRDTDRMQRNQDGDPLSDERLTPVMMDIMQRRFQLIMERMKRLYNLKVEFFRQRFGGHFIENINHESDSNLPTIGASPSLIIDTAHHLSIEQLLLLCRGPTYVPVGQMHVSPSLPFDQICSKQAEILQTQLSAFFLKYPISINRKTIFKTELKTLFQESFSRHLPTSIQQRATHERELVQSIRRQFKKDHLILRRTADHSNVFYLGQANAFEQKLNDYMNNTTSYELMGTIDENNPQQRQIDKIINSIDSMLISIHKKTNMKDEYLNAMKVKKTNLQLPYLYFLPELQQDGSILMQPKISSCNHCPIKPLASFLDELLRPLYEEHTQSTTLSNGAELIQRLLRYEEYTLMPLTHFATIKICHFYTMVSHKLIIAAVAEFLSKVSNTGRYKSLSFDTIKELIELVLDNNVFTYNNSIYRHIKGSPLSLPLTRTLGNIYLYNWQSSLTAKLTYNEEFYGRYHDTIIMSWAPPIEKLQPLLDELDQKHPDIRITTTIGSSVHFLDAYIENRKGKLYSRVYHEPTIQPFVLPYVMGHPRLFYRQWYQWALTRAVRYCTSIEDFDQERLYIELTLLANGYSLDFVNFGLTTFFNKYSVGTLQTDLDGSVYRTLRRRLLSFIQLEKQYRQQQQLWKSNNQLIHLHYLYDWGPRCQFNTTFKKRWSELIKNDPKFVKLELKLKLSSIHCYSLNSLLTQE